MGKSVQAVDATETKPVSCDKWSETLSEVRRKQSVKPARLQYTPLEPSLNGSSIEPDKFLLRQSMQPVMLPTPPLGLLRPQYEDLPNPKPNDKPQCNDAAMLVEVSMELDTKESDSQPSQEKMPSNDAVTLTDQSESQE
jgi:hypothetical protein